MAIYLEETKCYFHGCTKPATTNVMRSGTDCRGQYCRAHAKSEGKRLATAIGEDFYPLHPKPEAAR